MKDFKKLIREAHLGNPLNEIKPTPVSGTKSGATYSLDSDREIILKKDVKGAKIGDFINITLPKGTIIYNLPGGVFAKHKDLDDMFGGRNVRKDAKYGFSVIRSRDTLAAIEDAANLEESLNDDILDEDMNDPVLVKARAAKMADEKEMAKQASLDKKYGSNFMDKLDAEIGLKNELQDLKDERAQLMIDMEQEAEPEGGEIADEYGSRLNDIDAKMAIIKSELDDLRMYEVIGESSEEKDYFEHYDELPKEVLNLIDIYQEYSEEEPVSLKYLKDTLANFEKLGWTFDYGLDMEPYDLTPISDLDEGNGGAEQNDSSIEVDVNSDTALDDEVNKMGYAESLNKSLKEALNKRLGK